jgi:hypothetical protein
VTTSLKNKKKSNLPGPGPGRPKGLKNKLPIDLKKRILAVWDQLEESGKGLGTEAEKDPQWFYTNMVKPILPKDVKLDSDLNLTIKIVRFGDGNKPAK